MSSFRPSPSPGSFVRAATSYSWLLIIGVCLSNIVMGQNVRPAHFALVPCDIAGVSGKARCGTYEVFENRVTRGGRKITLKVVVFPATSAERSPDPFVYIVGGPGASATTEAPAIVNAFARIRERRDLVFVDLRGTGGSYPLKCELYNAADLQSYLGYLFPVDDVRKCREQLEHMADLTLYTTTIAMDDLDEVRAALG